MIRRHRGGTTVRGDESSDDDDEEDAFSALSSKRGKKTLKTQQHDPASAASASQPTKEDTSTRPLSTTSSMKRHHGMISDNRKAKMDALLVELEASKHKSQRNRSFSSDRGRGFVPDNKGSFVEPGQEHLTTNIFIGNLAPSITEEELTDLFRQFGDLYSVKIMWPRTTEERSRNRHSGFVCYMNRQDAEDAMQACDETDPFNCGRRIMMRWGKTVMKKGASVATRGPTARPSQQPSMSMSHIGPAATATSRAAAVIQVRRPSKAHRASTISTVASFVAKDGSALEHALAEREAQNPRFAFLRWHSGATAEQQEEHIFYKWRVYSFCQGDGLHTWRTEPFTMFREGCLWTPPHMDQEAARREQETERAKEETIQRQKQQRRFQSARRDYMTGRQLEQARKGGADGGAPLDPEARADANRLFRQELCASRGSICEAMAFCFDNTGAAMEIGKLLEDVLVESGPHVDVETRVARLFLLSDILFNTQQPGVRNAFLYRDMIERMTPRVFASLGRHGDGKAGRMTMNKLSSAVRGVLNAWTDWSVYNPAFIDELRDRFEGREIVNRSNDQKVEAEATSAPTDEPEGEVPFPTLPGPVRSIRQGTWSEIAEHDDDAIPVDATFPPKTEANKTYDLGGDALKDAHLRASRGEPKDRGEDGEPLDEDEDGEPMDDGADGEPLQDGEALGISEEDPDGAPLEDADEDGMPMD